MSKCCDNTVGGSEIHRSLTPDSGTIPSSSQQIEENKQELKGNFGYTSRLRPRPTRQTDYYRPIILKRKTLLNKSDCQAKRSASLPDVLKSTSSVRQTRASLLRGKFVCRSVKEQSSSGVVGKRHIDKPGTSVTAKRVRSEITGLRNTKKHSKKEKDREVSSKEESSQVKEVATKLWYPFIAPTTSSDSEEDDNFNQIGSSSSAASIPTTRKLASRSSKSNSTKTSTKEKTTPPATSSTSKSQQEATGAQSNSKVSSSKISNRFTLGRFSKTDGASDKSDSRKEASNNQASLLESAASSSQSGVRTRSALSKPSKSSKGKTNKSREEESKSKSRKRYQSPPAHPLYSRRPTTSSKTGSCASTSRRGRGKSSSANSHEQEEASLPPVMSREAAQSPEEAQASAQGAAAAADNQSGSRPADHSNADAEFDDPDMSRLQALLEARGLPSHFFGSLGPRVQQILHRSVNNGTNSKAQQLLQGMQASGDESRQLQSVIEMCQLLVMGNEDTLTGFPIKMVVPALITLLKMEHNFDMMNHACRALTYMMEALPRSSAVVVDAVPVFLEKLQSIQCMDVAEQSLTALEMLSRRHGASILRANGLSSCLLYLDFFSLPAQRNALTVAANCCSVLSPSDQHADFDKYYGSSITLLVQRLSHHDKKCVESVCLCFARLVDNFHNESTVLQKIASDGLLENFQNLLVVTPPVIASNTFVMVIRTMCLLCSSCPNLATQLVRNNIAETLRYLLCGTTSDSEELELVPRSPQELYEITSLIGELMPRLPLDDTMFSVDRLLKQNSKNAPNANSPTWQWRADEGTWQPYSKHDNRMIEEAHRSGDHEASLLIQGRVYMLDFTMMHQVNEDTGNSRSIRRHPDRGGQNKAPVVKTESDSSLTDARVSLVKEDRVVISQFVRSLFTLLYEVYGSSAGSPAVRHKCLRAVQRMIYYAEPDLLRDVLRNLSVSSHIASMLSSNDLKVVVGALQMAMILMNKLPDVFEVYFRRQGVTHQVEQLLDEKHKVVGLDQGSPPSGLNQASLSNVSSPIFEGAPSSTDPSPSDPMPGRLSDILRRKYPPRRNAGKRLSSSSLTPTPEDSNSRQSPNRGRASLSSPTERVISPPLTKAKAFAAAMTTYDGTSDTPTGPKSKSGSSSARSSATSFFYNLNPTRWGRSSTSSAGGGNASNPGSPHSIISMTTSSSSQAARLSRENLTLPNLKKVAGAKENKEQVKLWVREQAKIFLDKYFSSDECGNGSYNEGSETTDDRSLLKRLSSVARSIITCNDMSDACNSLRSLCEITSTSDVSSFELQHSGIVNSLIIFLTQDTETNNNNKKDGSVKRRSASVATPPMTTRRRSKTEAGMTTQSLDVERISTITEGDRPKSAPSDETGQFHIPPKVRDDAFQFDNTNNDHTKIAHQAKPVITLCRDDRLRHFLNIFVGLPTTHFHNNPISVSELSDVGALRDLIGKLNLCVNQLEQFAVESHDLPSAPGRGAQALSFFARHQLKCQLQRHPDCSKAKQWHGGPVRVDPLALVQAIERYLIARGYGAVSDGSEHSERRDVLMLMADEDSEDEIEVDDDEDDDLDPRALSTAASSTQTSTSTSSNKHRLELYIGNNKLPYNMTVYQAVKHFNEEHGHTSSAMMSSDDRDTDDEVISIASTGVWSSTHVIYYKLASDIATQNTTTGSHKKCSQKISPKLSKKNDALFTSGIIAMQNRSLDAYLANKLSCTFITSDPSKEVLCLMRIIFGLVKHWHCLYSSSAVSSTQQLISNDDFINTKLSTKANRQLQDPLMIMTGELPPWLSELAHACPFALPFETRQLLFRVVSFDRDRAMQYLLDTGALPDLNSASSNAASSSLGHDAGNRFMPKIEKKKCVVKRDNLLQQAEKLMQDHGHSRALLEIQYDGEVGTGLGPTLEFYTLASHELQRSELTLWRSDEKSSRVESSRTAEPTSLKKMVKKLSEIVDDETVAPVAMETSFVHSPVGLYPLPVGRSAKLGSIAKTCTKFRFLGKFLAKSVMDGRMADIPLSIVCYKWLLGKEKDITWLDLEQVDPGFSLTFNKLKTILHQRTILEREAPIDMDEKISSMTMDGCSLEDLGLDFLLPGFPNIELMKGGSKIALSINNIDKYLALIAHWTLIEGVRQQLDAMREGFQSVFPLQAIGYFFAEELDQLFCGARYQPWTERELSDSCRTDHGYNHDSEAVKTLFRVLSQYDVAEQRAFLQFVTGSPHLPVGGLRSLHPPLTIVRKSSEEGHSADEYLPSVMTCVNYLKLPDYSSEQVMRQRMCKAALEGQKSFLLS